MIITSWICSSLGDMRGFTQFIWTVDLSGANSNPKFDLNAGNSFLFGLFKSGTTDLFGSQSIDITGKYVIVFTASSSSSSSVAHSTTTDQPLNTSILGTSSTSSITPTPTPASVYAEPSKWLSEGAKAGTAQLLALVTFFVDQKLQTLI